MRLPECAAAPFRRLTYCATASDCVSWSLGKGRARHHQDNGMSRKTGFFTELDLRVAASVYHDRKCGQTY